MLVSQTSAVVNAKSSALNRSTIGTGAQRRRTKHFDTLDYDNTGSGTMSANKANKVRYLLQVAAVRVLHYDDKLAVLEDRLF